MDEKTVARFWSKVEKTPSCWLWNGGLWTNGYGRFWMERLTWLAHRASWKIATGTDPGALFVLHKCDNPRCVRPDHLFLGTQSDNMIDKVEKGRQIRGERRANAVWTSADATRLRRLVSDGMSIAEAARLMGMRYSLAKAIKLRRLWKHVP